MNRKKEFSKKRDFLVIVNERPAERRADFEKTHEGKEKRKVKEKVRKYLAEFIGTAILVIMGCGTAATVGCSSEAGSGYLLTALAFGLAIVATAYSIGKISGCHVNPAVSLAMLIDGKLSPVDFLGYVVSQCLGALLGAAILLPYVGKASGLGTNALYNGDPCLSIIIEAVLTFVFVLAIFGATEKSEDGPAAGLVIGLSLTLVHLLGIAYTGTSVNPARSFGPALLVGGDALKCVWVFFVGPLVGGAIAAFVWRFLIGRWDSQKKEA